MEILKVIIAGIAGYLIGSLSSAVIVSYAVSHRDVRNYGSGNAGATNMARIFGMGVGVATLLLDGLKTAGAMALGRLIGGEYGFLLSGFTCLMGHCFPVYFHFKGGKGVSVGAAIGLMLSWKVFALLVLVFFVTFALTRRVSPASMMCALTFTPIEFIVGIRGTWTTVLGIAAGLTVLIMHRENFLRLIRGEEKKFKPGRIRFNRDKNPGEKGEKDKKRDD